ncbi:hypothetical protein IQ278_04010 [Tolypothrix sp. LEGE 11397]|uniref:hypothetical protein n=1 Tax=unclassified Tolypothrix TaxID=2649714 RepID=UPI0005EAA930|nr:MULTISPECIES: hypothetical protein [unclassified Tolypothrix]EKE98944.1 hypothetical protein FDUTEX481_03132 [Tolypothrix sp. PCC 7601]MBE9081312.1 hypothetical protein [Tolypothrix sp. LEGE 11397]UYD28463.1 hypothetical protein HGR01_10730 [Tolypothrix sp. PCC 7712]UYD35627.1 hypothetical protein HG267_07655 [Tolypothrix sp. PCC 7601]
MVSTAILLEWFVGLRKYNCCFAKLYQFKKRMRQMVWAWGMAKKLPMPNAPSGGAAVPLHPQGDGVSRRFQ